MERNRRRAAGLSAVFLKKKIILTDFEQRVLRAALQIPFGQKRSYAWVAKEAGSPRAVRAVGRALHKNPFPLLVPCHRIVLKNGDPGGYAWGPKNKKALLDFEKGAGKRIS